MNNFNITVVCGTYKRNDLLEQTIESVLNSTHKEVLLIIVDDNYSSDRIIINRNEEIVSKYNDSRISIVKNDENIGVPYVFRKWITLIKTKYFLVCGEGDRLEPDAIGKMVQFLDENPSASFVCGLEYFDDPENGRREIKKKQMDKGIYDPFQFLRYHLTGSGESMGWSQASALYRTEFFKFKNIPVTNYHYWDHYFHCTYLLFSNSVGYINEYLAIRYLDKNLGTWARNNEFTDRVERLIQTSKFLTEYEINLIQKKHPVARYRIINSLKLLKNLPFCRNYDQFYLTFLTAVSDIVKVLFPLIFFIFFVPIKKAVRLLKGL